MIETMDQGTSVAANAVSGQRGPVEHVRRQQILQAANEHFRLYGYRKTTLADIAKSIHLSTPYLYKFFDSKQAIGEAICSTCLNATLAEIEEMVAATPSPVERLRRIFIGLGKNGWRLLNEQRKMHDIVAASFEERWSSLDRFNEGVSRSFGASSCKAVSPAILSAKRPSKRPVGLSLERHNSSFTLFCSSRQVKFGMRTFWPLRIWLFAL
jgi:AcrR family transcriptional regulator